MNFGSIFLDSLSWSWFSLLLYCSNTFVSPLDHTKAVLESSTAAVVD